jgi:hypothetical protein
LFGDEIISTLILTHLVSTTSKIRHGLVYSDVRPRDRQNFSSCQKICREDVFKLLEILGDSIPNTNGIYVYLKLIQSVIIAYYEKKTLLTDRLHYAWLSVFLCRLWWAWLDTQPKETLDKRFCTQFSALLAALPSEWSKKIKTPNPAEKKTKQHFTISNPCFFSIEINAQSLTFLVLLAIDGEIPFDVLTIDLLNSQSCESVFRLARAMSGVSSNIVNFSVLEFLRRADKISALQSIKTEHEYSSSETSLQFPGHHKHGKSSSGPFSSSASSYSSLRRVDIETIVQKAFAAAYDLIKPLIDEGAFQRKGFRTMASLSKFTIRHFQMSKLKDRLSQQLSDDQSEESDSEEEKEEEEEQEVYEGDDDTENQCNGEEEEEQGLAEVLLDSSDASFKGMRVKESINSSQADSFFKVRRPNDTADVYIHKQTACWVLMNEKSSLSSDRLKRVTEAK